MMQNTCKHFTATIIAALVIALSAVFLFRSVFPKTRRPYVVSMDPDNNAENVSEKSSLSTIILRLPNGKLNAATVTPSTVFLTEDKTGAVVPSEVNRTAAGKIKLIPALHLRLNTTYKFTITNGVKDIAGVAFMPHTIKFTTVSVPTNDIDSVGLGGNDSHAQGILFGGNTKNGIAIGNTLRHVAGYGIFVNGFGDFVFENNSIQSNSSGIFTKNHEPEQDLQKVGYQRFILRKNKIVAKNGKPVESYFRQGSIPSTVILDSSNEIEGKPYIEKGVLFVEKPSSKKDAP
jgi:hypothetical protein